LPCPTCGMSRGFGLLLSGDIFGAAALNPLTVLLPLILVVAWVVCLLRQTGWLPSGMTGSLSGRVSMGMRLATVFLFAGAWVYVMARKFG
jgi:hypothetical protein